ncbi:hypothetical protein Thivi_2033 [Thiocystis violascens DSM 198]|uniref:Uncharacterized protein n=1 Tax=Thiocystis violascens (strain ATCC 17096 / DSM 198 / 6111) TaxID=765911 RepID=I3YAH2_THIV6|nr:hypothetical protein Thivi_2033 [Thiocystis violascens DSM 198]
MLAARKPGARPLLYRRRGTYREPPVESPAEL